MESWSKKCQDKSWSYIIAFLNCKKTKRITVSLKPPLCLVVFIPSTKPSNGPRFMYLKQVDHIHVFFLVLLSILVTIMTFRWDKAAAKLPKLFHFLIPIHASRSTFSPSRNFDFQMVLSPSPQLPNNSTSIFFKFWFLHCIDITITQY